MYSMNRTSAPRARANSIRSTSSSSLTPRMTTVSSLRAGEERRGRVDAGEHAMELVVPRQRLEAIGVQRVEADRQAMQAGVAQRARVRRQQHAVGRHRQIANGRAGGEARDERREVAAQQRLAAGEPDLVHAEADEHVHELFDLLELQDVLARQPHVVLLGHAVAAAQVAPVGDRQPQVAQRTIELVLVKMTPGSILLVAQSAVSRRDLRPTATSTVTPDVIDTVRRVRSWGRKGNAVRWPSNPALQRPGIARRARAGRRRRA